VWLIIDQAITCKLCRIFEEQISKARAVNCTNIEKGKGVRYERRITIMAPRRRIDRRRNNNTKHHHRPSVLEMATASGDEDDVVATEEASANREVEVEETSEDDEDDEQGEGSKNSEDDRSPARKPAAATRKSKPNGMASRKTVLVAPSSPTKGDDSFHSADDKISSDEKDDSSDDDYKAKESSDEDDELEQVEDEVNTGKKRRGTTATATKARQSGRKLAQTSYAEERSSSEEEPFKAGKHRSTPSKRKSSRRQQRASLSSRNTSDEDDAEPAAAYSPTKRVRKSQGESSDEDFASNRRPSRASAVKAVKRLSRTAGRDRKVKAHPRSNRKKDSDEDDFVLEDDDDDDDVDLSVEEESSDDDETPERRRSVGAAKDIVGDSSSEEEKTQAVGIVKEGEVGAAEDSSDEEEDHIPYKSPQLVVKKRSRILNDSDDDDDDEISAASGARLCCTVEACPSEVDAITAEPLPPKHVCFYPPDELSRQCFALETLRTIATTTSHPQYRTDADGKKKQTFLQPPHFRTACSDDLLDQIASRFGRDALDLFGSFYNRGHSGVDYDWQIDPGITMLDDTKTFREQLDRYIQSRMGSQDVYCCPLCYIVAYQRFQGSLPQKATTKETTRYEFIEEKYPTDFSSDPITILGSVDRHEFEVASTFCFRRVSDLKVHLREDHNVDTKVVKGNDFYARFKIRATDGLLQRYLKKTSGRYTTRQGEMLSYWYHGNNELYLLLASLIGHAGRCRQMVLGTRNDENDSELDEEHEKFLQAGYNFFDSFAIDATDIWEMVTSPFRQASKEELKDMIDDNIDEDELGDDRVSHQALAMQSILEDFERDQSIDAERAARYQRLEESRREEDNSDEYEDDDNEHIDGGSVEEPSEEEDEWQQKILSKRTAKPRSSTSRRRSAVRRVTASAQSLRDPKPSGSDDRDDDHEDDKLPVAPSSSVRKRLVIDDSDDD
jgi:hypothetical protein